MITAKAWTGAAQPIGSNSYMLLTITVNDANVATIKYYYQTFVGTYDPATGMVTAGTKSAKIADGLIEFYSSTIPNAVDTMTFKRRTANTAFGAVQYLASNEKVGKILVSYSPYTVVDGALKTQFGYANDAALVCDRYATVTLLPTTQQASYFYQRPAKPQGEETRKSIEYRIVAGVDGAADYYHQDVDGAIGLIDAHERNRDRFFYFTPDLNANNEIGRTRRNTSGTVGWIPERVGGVRKYTGHDVQVVVPSTQSGQQIAGLGTVTLTFAPGGGVDY